MTFRYISRSVQDTHALGKSLAANLLEGDLIVLSGDLGAGKTQLVKGIAQGLNISSRITSPTFAIANTYSGNLNLHHLDVYRFESAYEILEAFDLGELQSSGIVVIEWGQLLENSLGDSFLEVKISHKELDQQRQIDLFPYGQRWTGERFRGVGL